MSVSIDYLVVGAGLFGSAFARRVAEAGKRVLLLDRRPHLAGNCYSEQVEGIEVHRYGPHIFHTSNKRVWEFVNQFSEFNHYRHRGVVRHGERLFSFPINLTTLHQLWGVSTPAEAQERLNSVREPCQRAENLEQWIVGEVGRELYEIFVRGYTTKQWGRDPSELPASIIRRIPIRLTWNDNYFNDVYQGIPQAGYTRMFEKLIKQTKPKLLLEVGSWKGASAIEIADILDRHNIDCTIVCIDTWLGAIEFWTDQSVSSRFGSLDLKHGYPTVYYQFLANVKRANHHQRIVPFPQTSAIAGHWFGLSGLKAQLIYVDASHSEEDVYRDLVTYSQCLDDDGIMFGDDYLWKGVGRAIDRFAAENTQFATVIEDGKWWFKSRKNAAANAA